MAEFMHESIVFCSAFTMSSLRKFTFAISSPDEFRVSYGTLCLKFKLMDRWMDGWKIPSNDFPKIHPWFLSSFGAEK